MMRAIMLFAGFALVCGAAPERAAEDPLTVQSKWAGKLTQKGKIDGNETALALDAELVITKRDGAKFEGELRETNDVIRVTYLVKGTIVKAKDGKGFAVEFKNYDFKDTESQTFLDIPYVGKLEGKKLTGTWKHPKNDNDTTIEGDFSLEKK
jgi:hypothetical protein